MFYPRELVVNGINNERVFPQERGEPPGTELQSSRTVGLEQFIP